MRRRLVKGAHVVVTSNAREATQLKAKGYREETEKAAAKPADKAKA